MMDVRQFKLSTGEEIICDVVEWPDDDDYQLVVQGVFKIIAIGDRSDGVRFYTFRPWLIYQDEPDLFQTIHVEHIVGEAKPSKRLLEQYVLVTQREEQEDLQKTPSSSVEELYNTILELSINNLSDSDQKKDNIIIFPNKPRLH